MTSFIRSVGPYSMTAVASFSLLTQVGFIHQFEELSEQLPLLNTEDTSFF